MKGKRKGNKKTGSIAGSVKHRPENYTKSRDQVVDDYLRIRGIRSDRVGRDDR